MNPKINKLKAEREKNSKKIAALQQRNREIDDSIHELENLAKLRHDAGAACGTDPSQQGRDLAAAARTAYRNGGI